MPENPHRTEESPASSSPDRSFSPLKLLISLVILIYLAETITMVILYFLQLSSYLANTLLDGAIMVVLIFPGLYFFQLKPLLKQMKERSQVEQALQSSEKMLKNVMETLPVGVWIIDKHGAIKHGNPATLEIWGGARYVGIEQYGEYKSWWLDTGKQIEPDEWAATRAIRRGETSLKEEVEIETFDGARKIILNSAKPLYDDQGALVGALVVNEDITERKRAELELHHYQEHLEELVEERTHEIQAIFSALQDGVLVYDKDMRATKANPSFYTTYGFDPVGLHVKEIIETVSCRWLDGRPFRLEDQPTPLAIAGKQVVGAQYLITRPDGAEMVVETSSAPLRVYAQVKGSVTVWHDITQLKQNENRLAYLATFPERNPNPVTEVDIEGCVRYVNPAAQHIFPDLQEQGLAHAWLKDWNSIIRAFHESENRSITRDVTVGEQIYEQSLHWFTQDGLIRIYGLDITQRRRANEALRASEERLKVTLNSIGDGVIATDAGSKITFLNPVAAKLTGWEQQKAIGQPIDSVFQVVDEISHQPGQDIVARAQSGRSAVVLENHSALIAKDGRIIPIEDSAAPILDAAGNVTGVVLVFHDVTEKRRTQAALLEGSRRLSQAEEIAHLGSWELNLDNNQLSWSDEAYRIFGLQPKKFEASYASFLKMVHPDDRKAVDAAYNDSIRTGKNYYEIEHRIIKHSNNEVRIVHEKCEHICNEAGQIIRSIGMVHDVTERVQAEAAIRAARDELELRVQERTQELEVANKELSNEIGERKRAEMILEEQNEKLRALSQSENRQRQLAESLTQATLLLNTSLELRQVLCSILEQIRRTISFQGANIYLIEGNTLQVASYLGFEDYPEGRPAMDKTFSLGDYPILRDVCGRQQPVNIDSVSEHPQWRLEPGTDWVSSYLAVPMLVGSEVTGIINLTSEQPAAFTHKAVEQVLAFAAPVALTIYNARLFKAESTARQVAETLSAAAVALARTLDLDQVLLTLMEHVNTIIASDISGVGLLDDEEQLVVHAAQGYSRWTGPGHIFTILAEREDETLVRKIFTTRTSQLVIDTAVEPLVTSQPEVEHIRNWLLVPIIAREKAIGLVGLGKIEPGYFTTAHVQWVEALANQAAVAIQNAWLFQQVRSSSERLQSLARKLVEIQEKEHVHIARELHDEAGQVLASLKLSLGRLEQDPDCPAHIRHRLLDLKVVADGVLEGLHRLAVDLRPIALDHLGLVAALEQYANNLSSEHLSIKFKVVGCESERLPQDLEISLYRIVQEALTNVIRHAQAANVGILLERCEHRVKLFVEDDGIGFAPDHFETNQRLGLVGMRERAEMFGGTLTIESSPGKGTSIIAEVPDANSHTYRR